MKNPFVRGQLSSGSPLSFRARGIARSTVLVFALVIVISALNELRCSKFGCVSRARLYCGPESDRGSYIGGGAVIRGTRNGEATDWQSSSDSSRVGEAVLVTASHKVESKGVGAGNGRWIDEGREKMLKEETKQMKEKKATVEKKDGGGWEWEGRENDAPVDEMEGHFRQTAAERHAKWEQGESQENLIRVPMPTNVTKATGNERKLGEMVMGALGGFAH